MHHSLLFPPLTQNLLSIFYPIKSFYLTFRKQTENLIIEDDTVYVNGVEDLFHITKKTFDFLKLNHVYDYVYRTNISTITNFHALYKQLPVMYAGDVRHV